MPHLRFTKGSPEAISHMKGLRERRKGHKHKPEGGCDSTKDAKCKEPEPVPEPEPIKEIEQIIKKKKTSNQERKNPGNN